MSYAIRVSNLKKSYGANLVIKGIDLEIDSYQSLVWINCNREKEAIEKPIIVKENVIDISIIFSVKEAIVTSNFSLETKKKKKISTKLSDNKAKTDEWI